MRKRWSHLQGACDVLPAKVSCPADTQAPTLPVLRPCLLQSLLSLIIYVTWLVRTEINTVHGDSTSVLSLAEHMTTDDVRYTPKEQKQTCWESWEVWLKCLGTWLQKTLSHIRVSWNTSCEKHISLTPHDPNSEWALWKIFPSTDVARWKDEVMIFSTLIMGNYPLTQSMIIKVNSRKIKSQRGNLASRSGKTISSGQLFYN